MKKEKKSNFDANWIKASDIILEFLSKNTSIAHG